MPNKLTTKQFIEKAIKVHGNEYDYCKVDYINVFTNVEIICSKHGSFFQAPNNHLAKHGCRKCSTLANAKKEQLPQKSFIFKAKKVHKNLFDYSNVVYTNMFTNVSIGCTKHGIFPQRPHNHLNGAGCPKCAGLKKLTKEEFIIKAKKIHSNKYDYSKVVYKNNKAKVEITCPKHGSFWQTPDKHSNHCCRGCPHCSTTVSKMETKWLNQYKIPIENRQYRINIDDKNFVVDGYSPDTNTIYEFLGDYWHGNPKKYDKIHINERSQKTFGELYRETINRIKLFEYNGYDVKYIWESDYKKLKGNSK